MHARIESPDQPDVRALIDQLDAYQHSLYPPEAVYALDLAGLLRPEVVFVVARDDQGRAAGCGAVLLGADQGELKRMFVAPSHRGQGVADQVMATLEAAARQAGCPALCLETGPYQHAALAFYARHGFERCGPFGGYPEHPLSVFMRKPLRAAD
jgi:putative acetyltransferase